MEIRKDRVFTLDQIETGYLATFKGKRDTLPRTLAYHWVGGAEGLGDKLKLVDAFLEILEIKDTYKLEKK